MLEDAKKTFVSFTTRIVVLKNKKKNAAALGFFGQGHGHGHGQGNELCKMSNILGRLSLRFAINIRNFLDKLSI